MPDTQPRKRKRAAVGKSDDSDEGKRRGRPRVEMEDESAADRRRTQIRMAQRAYRQRKESTLEELRKRVSELTTTVERMNQAFRECQNRIMASGLSNSQLLVIHETATQYAEFIKIARNAGDENAISEDQDARRMSRSRQTTVDQEPAGPLGKNVPSWLDQAALSQPSKEASTRDIGIRDIGLGYTLMTEPENTAQSMRSFNLDSKSQTVLQMTQRSAPPDTFNSVQIEHPGPLQLESRLSPPATYSSQETSFARCLHRFCLESGYQLLLDPWRHQRTYDRVFKLSLMSRDKLSPMSRDRAKLIRTMRSKLDRGPHESLESWEAPLVHVGGAGTHYPRKDQFGNKLLKKQSYHLGLMGPQTLALLLNAARDSISADMTVEIAGFEGEWLDPYDVEGYLEEKGIYIDPSASYAEAEVVDSPSRPQSLDSNTALDTQSSIQHPLQDGVTQLDSEQWQALEQIQVDSTIWQNSTDAQLFGVGYSDALTGSWENFILPNQSSNAFTETHAWEIPNSTTSLGDEPINIPTLDQLDTPQPRRRMAIIDVTKFIKILKVSSVCLGRGPGFKRRDVDRALAMSSFEAF